MTKLNISIPDDSTDLVKTIRELVAKAGGYVSVEAENKEAFKADFQEALHQAYDMMEGKAPRVSLKEAFGE